MNNVSIIEFVVSIHHRPDKSEHFSRCEFLVFLLLLSNQLLQVTVIAHLHHYLDLIIFIVYLLQSYQVWIVRIREAP